MRNTQNYVTAATFTINDDVTERSKALQEGRSLHWRKLEFCLRHIIHNSLLSHFTGLAQLHSESKLKLIVTTLYHLSLNNDA